MTYPTIQTRNDVIAARKFRDDSIAMYNSMLGQTVKLTKDNTVRGTIAHVDATALFNDNTGAHTIIRFSDGSLKALTFSDFRIITNA